MSRRFAHQVLSDSSKRPGASSQSRRQKFHAVDPTDSRRNTKCGRPGDLALGFVHRCCRLRVLRPGTEPRKLPRARNCLLRDVQTGPGAHQTSCARGTGDNAARGVELMSPTVHIVEVKNAWSCIPTPLYVCRMLCLVKQRDS